MNAIPDNIRIFLQQHHVASLAASAHGEIWSASCFYAADLACGRLIILTSRDTRHGRLMVANPHISGTIAGQPVEISEICGIQFSAYSRLLENETERQTAVALFYQVHPAARGRNSDVWVLELNHLKLTDNQVVFGQKTVWHRQI